MVNYVCECKSSKLYKRLHSTLALEHIYLNVTESAKKKIQHLMRQYPNDNNAVVFDIDETVVRNYCPICKYPLKKEEVIPYMKKLYKWCLDQNLSVFFITARTKDGVKITKNLLSRLGMGSYNRLFMQAVPHGTVNVAYPKTAARRYLQEKKNYHILASFGDQMTDLIGGFTEDGYLLPSFY
jgi:predicted secreted acid phosphatase